MIACITAKLLGFTALAAALVGAPPACAQDNGQPDGKAVVTDLVTPFSQIDDINAALAAMCKHGLDNTALLDMRPRVAWLWTWRQTLLAGLAQSARELYENAAVPDSACRGYAAQAALATASTKWPVDFDAVDLEAWKNYVDAETKNSTFFKKGDVANMNMSADLSGGKSGGWFDSAGWGKFTGQMANAGGGSYGSSTWASSSTPSWSKAGKKNVPSHASDTMPDPTGSAGGNFGVAVAVPAIKQFLLWPPPPPSTRRVYAPADIASGGPSVEMVGQFADQLENLVRKAGFDSWGYFLATNGFALVPRIETIDATTGRPRPGTDRWALQSVASNASTFDGLWTAARPKGDYRVFVFILTTDAMSKSEKPDPKQLYDHALRWAMEGGPFLDARTRRGRIGSDHRFMVLVYEFEHEEQGKTTLHMPSRWPIDQHLETIGVAAWPKRDAR
jgi:hypothetical protein